MTAAANVDLRHSVPDVLASTANRSRPRLAARPALWRGHAEFEVMREWNRR